MMMFEPMRRAIIEADPTATDVTGFVTVWVTPTDRATGWVVCVDPVSGPDKATIAQLLRDCAAVLDARGFDDPAGD